jgi:hypothetical protein
VTSKHSTHADLDVEVVGDEGAARQVEELLHEEAFQRGALRGAARVRRPQADVPGVLEQALKRANDRRKGNE